MRSSNTMIRSVGTATVALFLVAGAALATSSFVAGGRTADTAPAAATDDATETPGSTEEPTGTPEAEEPTGTPEAEEPTGTPEAEEETETPRGDGGPDCEPGRHRRPRRARH